MQLVDSHCHLSDEGLAGRLPEILANMAAARVCCALSVSVSKATFAATLAIAQTYPQIYASIGVHPDDPEAEEFGAEEMAAMAAAHEKVVAIGETGLDYHWCKGDLDWQHQRFITHIRAANQSRLPLIVHTREAAADTMRLLRDHKAHAGVIHCFTEDTAVAKQALDLGFYLSFSGILTFKNATSIQEAARYAPLDRILVETDSPYLAPVPKRGKPNEPAYVRHTAEFLAQLRGDTPENIAAATTENFYALFDKVRRNRPAAP
ncbi:MAG: TatD family hydrolase [Neisseria sp.]|nr:TatD family hydrolase [Neisseria sp.]